MKKGNLLKKSINLALSVFVAGAIIAVGADGSTMAAITGNDAIISNIVEAAEVTQIPWSTAYVYGLLPIDLSTGGQATSVDGTCVSMDYSAGANKDWVAKFTTAITTDGQVLQFQYMNPRQYLNYCGASIGGYVFTDAAQLRKLAVFRQELTTHQHLWEYSQADFATEMTALGACNVATNWYDAVDEGLYYRITCNYTDVGTDNITPVTGMMTYVEIKATGEVYGFIYREPTVTYNDILAKEIIYSCIPTKLQ